MFYLLSVGTISCGSDASSCDIVDNWSTAKSGSLCQVNLYSTPEKAMYCGTLADGTYDCSCGPVSAMPPPKKFASADMCVLQDEARVCAAIAACGW
jgi:hypothetical protein